VQRHPRRRRREPRRYLGDGGPVGRHVDRRRQRGQRGGREQDRDAKAQFHLDEAEEAHARLAGRAPHGAHVGEGEGEGDDE